MRKTSVDSFLGFMQWEPRPFPGEPLFVDAPGKMQSFWSIDSKNRSGARKSRNDWEVFLWGSMRDPSTGGKVVTIDAILQDLNSGINLPKILRNKEGEFIVAAWSETKQTGYLGVDPLGHIKAYYYVDASGVFFSSHPLLLSKYGASNSISKEGLELLLALRVIPAPYTVLKQVYKISPGSVLVISANGHEETGYFKIDEEKDSYAGTSFPEISRLLVEKLKGSIQRDLLSDQTLNGLFLSGGLDSGFLLGLAAGQGFSLQNFTVGYGGPPASDESQAAALTARAFDAEITVLKQKPNDVIESLQKTIALLPEPIGDISFYPQLVLAQKAAEEVEIVIDGTGADNIFGALNKTIAETYIHQYQKLPQFLRSNILPRLAEHLPSTRKNRLTGLLRKGKRFIEGSQLSYEDRQIYWTRLMHKSLIDEILTPEWHTADDICNEVLRKAYLSVNTDRGLLASTCMSVKGVLPYSSLIKLSTIEYLTGLSIRLPYLAPDFVHFAVGIPDEYKVKGRQVKYILRATAEEAFPEKLRNRDPRNFTPPMRLWIRGEMRELFMETLSQEGPFDREIVRAMIRDQFADRNDWLLELWVMFMFLTWSESSLPNLEADYIKP